MKNYANINIIFATKLNICTFLVRFYLKQSGYFNNRKYGILHSEGDVKRGILHGIDALGRRMIMRARVFGKEFFADVEVGAQCFKLWQGELPFRLFANLHLEPLPLCCVRKSATSVWVGIGIGYVGLDIVDRCAVSEVGTLYIYHRGIRTVIIYTLYQDGGESEGIGAVRTARGKHPHPLVATKTWRTHGEPFFHVLVMRESPDEPKVVKSLHSPYGIRRTVFFLEYYPACKFFHYPSLTGCTKLAAERGMEGCYFFHNMNFARKRNAFHQATKRLRYENL